MKRLNFSSENLKLRDRSLKHIEDFIKSDREKNFKKNLEEILKFGLIFQIIIGFIIAPISSYSEGKMVFGKNMLESRDSRLDINSATKEQMLKDGIAASYVTKIMDYKEVTGGFENLDELKRISGIGEATYQKLSKKFQVVSSFERKKIKINSADDTALKYFGFSKDEIKKIRKYHESRGKFDNNIPLMELLTQRRYEKYRDLLEY